MTSEKDLTQTLEKSLHTLEEICENTRAIRRVVNRILDHLHEQALAEEIDEDYDPDEIDWDTLDERDDMFS
jgi:transcription initiation factor IIE alpha subunit